VPAHLGERVGDDRLDLGGGHVRLRDQLAHGGE
jgi:hypothetical protein